MALSVQSFSYKRGVPRSVGMVFDVRFLRNPHWDATLRPLTGLDARVADYVAQDPRFDAFFDRMAEMVEPLVRYLEQERVELKGRAELTRSREFFSGGLITYDMATRQVDASKGRVTTVLSPGRQKAPQSASDGATAPQRQ